MSLSMKPITRKVLEDEGLGGFFRKRKNPPTEGIVLKYNIDETKEILEAAKEENS
jgi:hypothetical protein